LDLHSKKFKLEENLGFPKNYNVTPPPASPQKKIYFGGFSMEIEFYPD